MKQMVAVAVARSSGVRSVVLLVLGLAALAHTAAGQQHPNVEKGFKPGQAYAVSDVDVVNLFNGNLNVSLPIGGTYRVGGALSYGFTLAYSGNNWEYDGEEARIVGGTEQNSARGWVSWAFPNRRQNAGMGWVLTLGRLSVPIPNRIDPFLYPPLPIGPYDSYQAPDGGSHGFHTALHNEGTIFPDTDVVTYSRNGTYIRSFTVRDAGGKVTSRKLEFADGTIKVFDTAGVLREIRDRSGNKVTITSHAANELGIPAPDAAACGTSSYLTQKIDDGHRVHYIYSLPAVIDSPSDPDQNIPPESYIEERVCQASLAAFGAGSRANYLFTYAERVISRHRPAGPEPYYAEEKWSPTLTVPLLTKVTLPTLSSYEMVYDIGIHQPEGEVPEVGVRSDGVLVPNRHSLLVDKNPGGFTGHLVELRMPTRGRYEWLYRPYVLPPAFDGDTGVPNTPDGKQGPTTSVGVAERKRHVTEGQPDVWKYKSSRLSEWISGTSFVPTVSITTVEGPDGTSTDNYFSIVTGGPGERRCDYAAPYTQRESTTDEVSSGQVPANPYKGMYLSSRTTGADGQQRLTYVAYESDFSECAMGEDRNSRPKSRLTVFEDGREVTEISSDFDGLGHYRTTTTSASDSLIKRVSTTNFNPGASATGTPAYGDDNWIIGTYDAVETADLDKDTSATISQSRAEYCFDPMTGRLLRTRSLRGESPGGTDLLTVYRDEDAGGGGVDGDVSQEEYYGGDELPLSPTLDTCGSLGSATPQYRLHHEYQNGSLKSTRYDGTIFKVVDLTIDPSGLPSATRDGAGLATTLQYDLLGRLIRVTPPGTAWSNYKYTEATATTGPSVTAQQCPSGQTETCTTPWTEERHYYDAFGRLIQQRRRMPNAGTTQQWAVTEVEYDQAGRSVRSTVPLLRTSGDYAALSTTEKSTRVEYDFLGRVKKTTLPDGSSSETRYKGATGATRSATIATPDGVEIVWNGEEYDPLGRLVRVTENALETGEPKAGSVSAEYEYDQGNRLVRVESGVQYQLGQNNLLTPVESGVQTRTFSYDGAGLLTDEDHPELAPTYYRYDARGHLLNKTVSNVAPDQSTHVSAAAVALGFDYDPAERLLTVTDTRSSKVLKSLTYDTARPGQLATQTRFNHFPDSTYAVTDAFSYDAATGRPSTKVTDVTRTDVGSGAFSTQRFTHAYDYTELGAPDHVNYPTCPSCGANARSLQLGYQDGFLTGIQQVTAAGSSGISYTPAGAVHQVQHAKEGGAPGVLDTFEPDPDGMARILEIRYENLLASVCELQVTAPDQSISYNTSALLTATATGSEPLLFEWYQGPLDDTSMPVHTGSSFSTAALTVSTDYWVRVTNSCGTAKDAVHVDVAICGDAIAIEAVPSAFAEGSPFQLRAPNVSGATYRWYRVDGSQRTLLATTSAPAYDVPGIAAETAYAAELQNGECMSPSNVLIVDPCLKMRTIAVIKSNDLYRLAVANDQADVTFQWYEGFNHEDLSKPRGTGFEIFVDPETATHYWVRMTRLCGGVAVTVDSDFVFIDPDCLPSIFVQPVSSSATRAVGSVSATVTAGGAGPFTYQWWEVNADGTSTMIGGAVGDTYTWFAPAFEENENGRSRVVRAQVHQGSDTPAESNRVTLAFANSPQRIAQTSGSVVRPNPYEYAHLFVTMDPPASSPPASSVHEYTYDWYVDDGTPEGLRYGQTTSGLSAGATGSYWVIVKGIHDKGTAFEYHEVTVSPRMSVTLADGCALAPLHIEQSLTEICLGGPTNENPMVTFRAINGTPNVIFQWYLGQTGDTRNPVSSSPGKPNELTIYAHTVEKVWVRASLDCGVSVDSPTHFYARGDCAPLIIDQHLPGITAVWGEDAELVFPPLADPDTRYHWREHGVYGAPDVGLSGTESTLHLPAVTRSAYYVVHVVDRNCANSGSDTYPALVRVASAPGMTPPNWVTEVWRDADSTTGTILSADTVGGERWQWFLGDVLDQTHPVSDSTLPTFTTPNLTEDTRYWVRVHGSGETFLDSPTITVKVCNVPSLTAAQEAQLLLNREVAVNQLTVFYVPFVQPAGGTQFTYQWYRGVVEDKSHPLFGENSPHLSVTQAVTTQYWFSASSVCNGETREYPSPTFTANVCTTPDIDAQPSAAPTRSFPGAPVVLSVMASVTSPGTLTYQWYAGAVGVTSAPVSNGTSASITVYPAEETTYWVQVTRGVCVTDSAAVTVLMCNYPQTVALAANANIAYGASTTIQFPTLYPGDVKVTRWYRGAAGDRANLVAGGSVPALDFTTPALTETTQYWMEFEHNGCLTTSTVATLTVCKPTITTQPVGATIASGSSHTLTVATTPIAGQTFQWYMGAAGTTSSPVAGGTTASITVSPTATTSYWVRVRGTCTPEATTDSAAATVTVCNAPVISAVSPLQYISSGQSAAVWVTASGANRTYQWYVGTTGTTTSPISGATSSTYAASPTTTTNYWCRVTSEGLCSVNSATTTIDVCTLPVITQQATAVPQRIFNGASSTLSVTATGNGPLTYQWYVGAPGVTSAPVAGGTSATITVSPTVETSYWVRVTTRVCSTDSAAVTVSMCTYAQGVTLAANVNIAYGGTATLQFPNLYPGDVKTIRWYRGASGDRSNLVAGGNLPSLNFTTPALTATTQYWMEFEHNGCLTTSTTATVTVCKPTITAQPQSAIVLSGASHTLTVTATASPLTYQWYIGNSGLTSQPIAGATAASLTVTPSATTTYWVRATGCSTNADSAAATVTVCAAPGVTNLTKTSTYAIGGVGTITVTATGTSLTYQWYKGQSGDTSLPISGATAASYTFGLQTSQYYWVRVTSGCNGATANSAAVLYSVAPKITAHPADVTIPRGTSATLSVTATGTYLTYQWIGPNGTFITGATSSTYTTPVLTTGVNGYYCSVKSGTVGVNSVQAFVSLCDGPTIMSFGTTYNSGSTYRLTVMVHSSQYSLVKYHWYRGVPGSLAQSTDLGELTYAEWFNVTSPTTYWVRVWFNDDTCYTDTAGKTLP